MDEREAQLRQQWADHKKRFKSGAKRSSLRGVIKSSYLTEMGGRPDGRRPTAPAAASAASKPLALEGHGASSSPRFNDSDGSWEDVRSTNAASSPVTLAGKWSECKRGGQHGCGRAGVCVGVGVGVCVKDVAYRCVVKVGSCMGGCRRSC